MTHPQPSQDQLCRDVVHIMASFVQGYGGEAKTGILYLKNDLDAGQPRHPHADRWIAVLNQLGHWHREGEPGRFTLGRALTDLYESMDTNSLAPLALLEPDPDGDGLKYGIDWEAIARNPRIKVSSTPHSS